MVQKEVDDVFGRCTLEREAESMGRARSRAKPDYTINRISAGTSD